MNRLTRTYEDGSYGAADDLPCGENSQEFKRLLINKLGALEDQRWISVDERLPQTRERILVFFRNEYGKARTTCAEYILPKTVLEEDFLDPEYSEGFAEYDEEKDCYWTPDGFYESNYETDVNYFLSDKVTHWMPLPQSPEATETA